MQFEGLFIGIFSFAIIALFHPLVVKGEYYFTSKIWPMFLISGLLFLLLSATTNSFVSSTLFSITGFTCLWSIGELKEQEERVQKGWFPENPNRKRKASTEDESRKSF